MYCAKRISFVLTAGIFLFCNASYAQMKYSRGPICKDNEIVCADPDTVARCYVLDPKIHEEIIINQEGERVNRFQPSCGDYPDNLLPTCVNEEGKVAQGVVLDCIEPVKCQLDTNNNKLVAVCSNGKVPKCLGNDNTPNCEAKTPEIICKDQSVPAICDYIWEATVPNHSYR